MTYLPLQSQLEVINSQANNQQALVVLQNI